MLRSIIEKWTRGIVLKRRLPVKFGSRPIFVSPEGGGLRYWKPRLDSIDPMLLEVVRTFVKPGATVWDVGGNVGFFAFTSAVQSKGGKIATFEPDLSLAYLLRKTADANPDLDVSIFPFAVSNRNGTAQFNIAERARSTNFLAAVQGSTQTGGVRRTLTVPTVRLDTVLDWFVAPDFIKIDVEGAEHLVFEGMEKVLSAIRPIILCEVSSENQAFVSEILHRHRYQLLDADKLPQQIEVEAAPDNVLAIPLL